MKLALPDVTLICIDTVCHELAVRAIVDSVGHCDFANVIFFTDRDPEYRSVIQWEKIEPIRHVNDYGRILWLEAWRPIKTSHFLVVQWDGWVIDPGMWSPKWLQYDYIGAPWGNTPRGVGNGGFSLRSIKLAKYVAMHHASLPLRDPEDAALCRMYRGPLEQAGFRWAPFNDALDFSFECCRRDLNQRHFGFHAFRNWPFVLDKHRLSERLGLVNDYIRRDEQILYLQDNLRGLEAAGMEPGYIQ